MRKSVTGFIRRNLTTIGMALFLALFYSVVLVADKAAKRGEGRALRTEIGKGERLSSQELREKEMRFRENLLARPPLLAAMGLGFLFIVAAGILLNVVLFLRKMKGHPLVRGGIPHEKVPWGLEAVVQVFVTLFFIDTLLVIVEASVAPFFGWGRNHRDFLLMLNGFLRDVTIAAIVVIFVRHRFGQPLGVIGLTRTRFFSHVKLGALAYLAVIPALLSLLFVMSLAAQTFSYEPPPQPVVEIYLKESTQRHIVFLTFFVAVVGPIIEEVFFRGFAYKAFRTRFGARAAIGWTAAVFASFHLSLIAFPPIFLLGIFLAYLYERTGSLVPSMTAHIIHNIAMVAVTMGFKWLSG